MAMLNTILDVERRRGPLSRPADTLKQPRSTPGRVVPAAVRAVALSALFAEAALAQQNAPPQPDAVPPAAAAPSPHRQEFRFGSSQLRGTRPDQACGAASCTVSRNRRQRPIGHCPDPLFGQRQIARGLKGTSRYHEDRYCRERRERQDDACCNNRARPLREGENGVGDRCRHKTTSSFDFRLLGGINGAMEWGVDRGDPPQCWHPCRYRQRGCLLKFDESSIVTPSAGRTSGVAA